MRKVAPFVLTQFASITSVISGSMVFIAVPWIALEITGTATSAGLVVALTAIPGLFMAPVIGSLIDRFGRRNMAIISELLTVLTSLMIPLVSGLWELTLPALVIVGFLMMTQVAKINFSDYTIAIPAFLTIILMPFTYSITNGIGAGLVSYVVIKIAQRKTKDVPGLLWIIAAAFVIYFAVHPLKELLGL